MKACTHTFVLLVVGLALSMVHGFASLSKARPMKKPHGTACYTYHASMPSALSYPSSLVRNAGSSTALAAGPADGSDRGVVILGFVFLVSVWIFSIPPEFRRTHVCTTDLCVENRSACYDCVTLAEWSQSVKEYYQNGGGISFDFSVAQETKDLWAGKIK